MKAKCEDCDWEGPERGDDKEAVKQDALIHVGETSDLGDDS